MRNYQFHILEQEIDADGGPLSHPYAIYRQLTIIVRDIHNEVDQNIWDLLRHIEKIMMSILDKDLKETVLKKVLCALCLKEMVDQPGYFVKSNTFLNPVGNRSCQYDVVNDNKTPEHTIHDFETLGKSILVESENFPTFNFKDFLKIGIKNMKTDKFRDIRKSIVAGDQIWIVRKNFFARCVKPYAHVVIHLEQNLVCHVSKANLWKGIQKRRCPLGMVIKEKVEDVINDNDDVFLGHSIPGCKQAMNTRDQILKRALACEGIVFDYDSQNNCETFANSLFGLDCSVTAQGENIPCCSCVACLFHLVNCFRCYRKKISLATAMKSRLEKRELWLEDD